MNAVANGWSSELAIHRVMGVVQQGGTVYVYHTPIGYMSTVEPNLHEILTPVELRFIVKPKKNGISSN